MNVHIGEILKQSGLYRRFHYEGDLDLAEADLDGGVEIDLKLTNVSSRILVEGVVKTSIILECARCLESFDWPVEIEIQEQFLPAKSPELEDRDLGWDNLSLFAFSEDRIELYEVLRQNILASIPAKPLCDEECPGLDWNNEDEDSEEESVNENTVTDPRLLPLLGIKRRSEEEGNKSN